MRSAFVRDDTVVTCGVTSVTEMPLSGATESGTQVEVAAHMPKRRGVEFVTF
jgi:hypothetical protein